MKENYSYYYWINWKEKRYSQKSKRTKNISTTDLKSLIELGGTKITRFWEMSSRPPNQTVVVKLLFSKKKFVQKATSATQEKLEQTEITNENTQKVHFTTGVRNRKFNSPANQHTSLEELEQTNQVRRR